MANARLEETLESRTARAAFEHIRAIAHPAIFAHGIRTFVYASALAVGELEDLEALFVACVFHDAGASEANDGTARFEVEGADAASRFLRGHRWSADRVRRVWEAIALHTSPQIAERMDTMTRLVRQGVLVDFGARGLVAEELVSSTEAAWPRQDIERVLADAVIAQALERPEKAPRGSWPGALLAAHLTDPDRKGPDPAF